MHFQLLPYQSFSFTPHLWHGELDDAARADEEGSQGGIAHVPKAGGWQAQQKQQRQGEDDGELGHLCGNWLSLPVLLYIRHTGTVRFSRQVGCNFLEIRRIFFSGEKKRIQNRSPSECLLEN